MVVLEISKSNRSACRTCHNNIDKDVLKIGTVKSNDGYMNMDWHHEACFWTKRAAQYYKRKGKKCNVLLKVSQFSGQNVLSPAQIEELAENILASNLKWGSKEALEKAGIAVPVTEKDVDTKKSPTKGVSNKRTAAALKEVKEESEVNEEPVEDVVKTDIEDEVPQFHPSGRAMRRKTQK